MVINAPVTQDLTTDKPVLVLTIVADTDTGTAVWLAYDAVGFDAEVRSEADPAA